MVLVKCKLIFMDEITVVFEERKNKIVKKMPTEYALNHMSLEEYERLIKYSSDIETERELQILEKIIISG